MPQLYFDIENGLLLINGNVYNGGAFIVEDNTTYGLIYAHGGSGFMPLVVQLKVCNNMPQFSESVKLTRVHYTPNSCGNRMDNTFFVKFCPRSYEKFMPPQCYYSYADNSTFPHALTAYKQGDYYITVENANEMTTLNCPDHLDSISFKSEKYLSGGSSRIIFVSGQFDKKKYVAILIYDDDYHTIFQATCNNFVINKDGIVVTDSIDDMFSRLVSRCFVFDGNKYSEQSRQFEYRASPCLIDELLPYAFVESLACGDFDMCKSMCTNEFAMRNFSSTLGSFKSIVTRCELGYVPFRLALSFNEQHENSIKFFNFTIEHSVIIDVTSL